MIGFEVSKEHRLLVVWFQGPLTLERVEEYREGLRGHPDFRSDFQYIGDFRDSDTSKLDAFDLLLMAHTDPHGPRAKRAFLADEPQTFARAKAYGHHLQAQDVRVFGTLEAACVWLGVPVEAAAEMLTRLKGNRRS
jgi:hypothetical protein